MELYHASRQWATRPADERFQTLEAMHASTKAYAESARIKEAAWSDLRVEAQGDDLALIGKAGVPARLTNYAFGQVARRIGAPAGYLRELPATLAAQNLNHGLKERTDGTASLLFHQNEGLILRAATSDVYARLWDHEIVERLIDLSDRHHLTPAHQTFNWSKQEMTDQQKAEAPRALYASDHDLFAFLMSRERGLGDPVGKAQLFRGVIVTNSEVGDRALGIMGFYFRDVCCNHIIWSAEQLATIRIAHVGEIARKWAELQVTVRRYFDEGLSFDAARFDQVKKRIAATKDELLDLLFGKRGSLGMSRKTLEASYAAVVPDEDGDPLTAWGFAQGVTRHAQTVPYADDRTELDRAAGKILDFDF